MKSKFSAAKPRKLCAGTFPESTMTDVGGRGWEGLPHSPSPSHSHPHPPLFSEKGLIRSSTLIGCRPAAQWAGFSSPQRVKLKQRVEVEVEVKVEKPSAIGKSCEAPLITPYFSWPSPPDFQRQASYRYTYITF